MKHGKGLIWFDCDGVLTVNHSSWAYLHEYFGSRDNSFFAELYRKGYISYIDWMKIDIALMIHSYGRPIRRSDVEKALSNIEVREGAIEAINELKKRGYIVGVASSGIDILVKRVCRAVGADICLYNELLFVDDLLIPGGKANVPLKEKVLVIEDYSKKMGYSLDEVVYVGDSVWDIDVFEKVGLSIAVKPCGDACRYADHVVKDLREIPGIIDKHYS
jgi:phosphoserine phosphatase